MCDQTDTDTHMDTLHVCGLDKLGASDELKGHSVKFSFPELMRRSLTVVILAGFEVQVLTF